jgi:hypothetical protein
MAGEMHHYRFGTDPSDHRIKHARTRPTRILSREGYRSHPGMKNLRYLWKCGKGEARLQGRLHSKWCSAPRFLVDHW